MAEPWKDLSERVKSLAGSWASYAAFGSFGLYLLGYLSLRFHLTAFGVGSGPDLAVLDERYLLAGARFLVYLCLSVPIVVLFGLAVGLPWVLLPPGFRARLAASLAGLWGRFAAPSRLALLGVILSTLLVQLVMRKCVALSNVLLADDLGVEPFVQDLLLTAGATGAMIRSLYFSGLVAAVAATGGLLLAARAREGQTPASRLLSGLLTFLVALQFLLLPVTHGVLIADRTLAKVTPASVPGLAAGQEAWLVWEGKESTTFLVRTPAQPRPLRTLVTLARKDAARVEITGQDGLNAVRDP